MGGTAFALTGAKVFDGERITEGLAVIIEGRFIRDAVEEPRLSREISQHRLNGGLIAPGFIDVQVNGGGGALFNNEPHPEGVRKIAEAHRRFGTTGLLPTVITDAPKIMSQAIAAVRTVREEGLASVLGIHVEGPFIDPKRKGAHDARFIRNMTEADCSQLGAAGCGTVMVTLAPNCVEEAMIARLAQAGIIVSLGHSDAKAEQAKKALAAGARAFTHLFNAMSQMEGRAAGMVGAALADRQCYCSVIADGHHVEDVSLKAALAAKGKDLMVLISDAMSSAAGGADAFELQGRRVKRVGGRLELEDGTLAGSNLTMVEAVRHCVRKLNVPLEDALRMASTTPARLIGRERELGRIAAGYLASLVHMSDDLEVKESWVEGSAMTSN